MKVVDGVVKDLYKSPPNVGGEITTNSPELPLGDLIHPERNINKNNVSSCFFNVISRLLIGAGLRHY